jgi:hypothetical protein
MGSQRIKSQAFSQPFHLEAMPTGRWQVDFLAGLAGVRLTGMSAYMFDAGIPLFARGLSLFHFWLPIFLLLMGVCYFLMPAPPAPSDNPNLPVNINYVYGLSDKAAQTWMPPLAYFVLMLVVLPLCIFWPTHLLLRRVMPSAKA